jgi:phosphatidylglycerol:prolipoprotein diacylglycerol transferase
LKLHSYGLMIAIGFLVVLYCIQREAAKEGIDAKTVHEMAFWGLFWGIVGTRLMHIAMYSENYSWNDPIGWIALWNGGLVFQGGFLAVIYVYLGLKRRGISFWVATDIVLPFFPLGHAFGRLGCFLNGCCFGQRAEGLPWAVQFPRWPHDLSNSRVVGSPPYLAHARAHPDFSVTEQLWSYPIHPTQLYSAAGLVMIALTIIALKKWWYPFKGFTVPVYLVLYGTFRFFIEFIRDDSNPTNLGFGVLSNQQMFCLLMIAGGIVLYIYLRAHSSRSRIATV